MSSLVGWLVHCDLYQCAVKWMLFQSHAKLIALFTHNFVYFYVMFGVFWCSRALSLTLTLAAMWGREIEEMTATRWRQKMYQRLFFFSNFFSRLFVSHFIVSTKHRIIFSFCEFKWALRCQLVVLFRAEKSGFFVVASIAEHGVQGRACDEFAKCADHKRRYRWYAKLLSFAVPMADSCRQLPVAIIRIMEWTVFTHINQFNRSNPTRPHISAQLDYMESVYVLLFHRLIGFRSREYIIFWVLNKITMQIPYQFPTNGLHSLTHNEVARGQHTNNEYTLENLMM